MISTFEWCTSHDATSNVAHAKHYLPTRIVYGTSIVPKDRYPQCAAKSMHIAFRRILPTHMASPLAGYQTEATIRPEL
jgi:hypothetical protein